MWRDFTLYQISEQVEENKKSKKFLLKRTDFWESVMNEETLLFFAPVAARDQALGVCKTIWTVIYAI